MELLNLIQPTSYKDIVGNRVAIKTLLDYLKESTNTPKLIGLIGPIGCGKTTICDLVFKELNFNVHNVSTKETLVNADNILTNRTIDHYINSSKKKILFLDNVEILMTIDKNALSIVDNIIPNLIRTSTYLVLTCKPSEEKALTTYFKKNIEIIKLGYPPIKDSFIYLSTKLPDIDEEQLLNIVKKQRGNIRDIVLNLQQSDQEITEIVKDRGFKEYNTFEIVQSFMFNNTWDTIDAILESDPSMVSYLLYENILDEVYNNREATMTMKTYNTIVNSMVDSNILEKFMQESLDWSMYNAVQITKIGGMYIALKDLKTKSSRKDIKFRFSQVLSKLSHKNIMNKKIYNVSLPYLDIINMINDNKIEFTNDGKQISTTYHKYFT